MPNPEMLNDTQFTGLLKNLYADFRLNGQNLVTPLWAQLERANRGMKNMQWGGNGVFWDVVLTRPATGTFSPGGFFSTDSTTYERQATAGVARAYITRELDNLAAVGTKGRRMAYMPILEKIYDEIQSASRLQMQAALQGAGNGILCNITTVSSTTSIIVSNTYGVTGAGQGTLLLAEGDYIAVRDAGGTVLRGKAQITAITSVSATSAFGTLTLGNAITGMQTTDFIVKATTSDDSYSATAGNYVPNGLINITNRGGSYAVCNGLSATDWNVWNCVKMVAGTDTPDVNTPTEDDVWQLLKRVGNFSGKDPMTNPEEFLLMAGPGMIQKLAQTFVGQRRFTPEQISTRIKGGYRAVEICGLAAFEDFYTPAGTIYVIHLPSLAKVDAKDWGYASLGDAPIWRPIQGRDAYQTTYSSFLNVAALLRNPHGSITGYTDTSVFYTSVAA